MFEDVLIMMSSNNEKIKGFSDVLKKNKIAFTIENFHDNRRQNKCIYVKYFKHKKAQSLLEEFNKTFKY